MTVTKLWHFDAPSPIDINKGLASASPDQATRTILRIGNIANNARLSRAHANSPATASSAAIMSSMLGHDPDAVVAKSRWVGQPTDVAILDLIDAFGEDDVRDRIGPRTSETPFSSERKWMGVVLGASQGNDSGNGVEVAYIKGALEQVLNRCDTYISKDGREIILDEPRRQAAVSAAEKMAEDGLRVLGFASGTNRDIPRSARTAQAPSQSGTPRPGTTASRAASLTKTLTKALSSLGLLE